MSAENRDRHLPTLISHTIPSARSDRHRRWPRSTQQGRDDRAGLGSAGGSGVVAGLGWESDQSRRGGEWGLSSQDAAGIA